MFVLYYLFIIISILIGLVGNYFTFKSYLIVTIKKPCSVFKNYFDFSNLPLKRKKDKIFFFVPSIIFFILVMSVNSMFIYFSTFEEFSTLHIYIISSISFGYVICFLILNWFIHKEVSKIKFYSNSEYKEFVINFFEENKTIKKNTNFEFNNNSKVFTSTAPLTFNIKRYTKKINKINLSEIEKRYKVFVKFLAIFSNIVPRIGNDPNVFIVVDNEQISYEKFLEILQENLRYILVN